MIIEHFDIYLGENAMIPEYSTINTEHFDFKILFFGHEQTKANYAFSGKNTRNCYVLHYILKGGGIFTSAGQKFTKLKAGDLFLLPKAVPCFYQADAHDPWEYIWIGFSSANFENILANSQLSANFYLKNIKNSKFSEKLLALYDQLHPNPELAEQLQFQSDFLALWANFLQEYPANKSTSQSTASKTFIQARDYIQKTYTTGINISDVCANLHLSRSYLYTLFKKYLDLTPQQYLATLRIEHAKKLLTNSNTSVESISSQIGYKDAFTFSKAFKRQTAYSPLEYRKSYIKN